MKLGYLGPKGTFSEQAALMYAEKCTDGCEFKMFFNITDVIEQSQALLIHLFLIRNFLFRMTSYLK